MILDVQYHIKIDQNSWIINSRYITAYWRFKKKKQNISTLLLVETCFFFPFFGTSWFWFWWHPDTCLVSVWNAQMRPSSSPGALETQRNSHLVQRLTPTASHHEVGLNLPSVQVFWNLLCKKLDWIQHVSSYNLETWTKSHWHELQHVLFGVSFICYSLQYPLP